MSTIYRSKKCLLCLDVSSQRTPSQIDSSEVSRSQFFWIFGFCKAPNGSFKCILVLRHWVVNKQAWPPVYCLAAAVTPPPSVDHWPIVFERHLENSGWCEMFSLKCHLTGSGPACVCEIWSKQMVSFKIMNNFTQVKVVPKNGMWFPPTSAPSGFPGR